MRSFDVTLVTYEQIPELTSDDQRLAAELERRGLRVRSAIWSDSDCDWNASGLTVIRSTWDYFHRPDEYLQWLASIESETQVVNPPALIRWNYDKHYLAELQAKSVTTVPTKFVEQPSRCVLTEAASMFGTTEIVIKPAISGAAWGTARFALNRQLKEALTHLEEVTSKGSAMVQPFLGSVLTERERSLVFFDGAYSHSYLKPPFSAGAGGKDELAHQPTSAEFELASAVLRCLDEEPAYARVDMALLDGQPHLMELELIEPALHFHISPGSEAKMADAIARRRNGSQSHSVVSCAA